MKHPIIQILFVPLTCLSLALTAKAEWQKIDNIGANYVAKSHPGLLAYCREVVARQYMVAGPPKHPPSVQPPPGWNDVWSDPRMIETSYSVADDDGTIKKGRVVLFNPSPELLTAWIANATIEVCSTYDEGMALQFAAYIKSQSSAQFPVVGTVWEDLKPRDGVQEAYPFLDGVTMKESPFEFYKDPAKKTDRTTQRLGDEILKKSLSLRWKPGYPATFARIASTTREMAGELYKAMGATVPNLVDADFASYVRQCHITAMKGNRNELLVAKLLFYRTHGKWTE